MKLQTYELEGLKTLTVKAICLLGSEVPVDRLSMWLSWCLDHDARVFQPLDSSTGGLLKQWLMDHPQRVKDVLVYRVANGMSSWAAQHNIPSSSQPAGLGRFWLEQAGVWSDQGGEANASDCLATAFWWIDRDGGGVAVHDFEEAATIRPALRAALDPHLSSPLNNDNWRRKNWLENKKYRDAEASRKALDETNRLYLLDHLNDVREGKLLGFLSGAAWGDLRDSGYGGGPDGELFKQWREAHPELDAATRQGYQTLLNQLTADQAADAVKNHQTGHILHIELPCLLAAQQLYQDSPQRLFDLGEERLKAIITLHLLNLSSKHDWFFAIVERHPDWVEEVWWSLCASTLRSKTNVRIPHVGLLQREVHLRYVAQRLLPRILTAWPSKISESNFPEFVQVLESVLDQCAPEQVSQLVAKRLKRKSLGSLQTGYLIMAGLWVDHQTYAALLQSLLNRKQIVQTELLGFVGHLHRYGGNPAPLPDWDAPTLGLLFRIFGPLCPAEQPDGYVRVGVEISGRTFVHQLLDSLRNDTSEAAQRELQQLLSDPALQPWKFKLEETLSRQSHARAEQAFEVPTPRQVALTLHNKSPANPSDLMAVAVDALDDMQREIRNHSTNLINSFWSWDHNGKHPRPPHKPENACRDVIAQWLKPLLSNMSVAVLPELLHGAQKRSDLGLLVHQPSVPEMLLPIEVKGDWHSDLWTAAHRQLVEQYANDSRCRNQGIYLVLWLGKNRGTEKKPKTHPNHPTPTPDDLQWRLQAEVNQKVHGQRISVIVLDISIPD